VAAPGRDRRNQLLRTSSANGETESRAHRQDRLRELGSSLDQLRELNQFVRVGEDVVDREDTGRGERCSCSSVIGLRMRG
jgi:hypothetical protein